jgi:hypothetical protein
MAVPIEFEIVWDKCKEKAVVVTLGKSEGDDGSWDFD